MSMEMGILGPINQAEKERKQTERERARSTEELAKVSETISAATMRGKISLCTSFDAMMTLTLQAAFLLTILASLCSHIYTMTIKPRNQKTPAFSRRDAFACSAASAASIVIFPSQPANAIKERNEALCKTGFFTNIGQWYCTDIGNIADEGQAGDLSKSQDETADSLMTKLGLSANEPISNNDSNDNKSNDEEDRSKQ